MTSIYFWYIYTLAPTCDTSYGCGVVLSLIQHVASTSLQSKVILGSAVDILSRCGWMFTSITTHVKANSASTQVHER